MSMPSLLMRYAARDVEHDQAADDEASQRSERAGTDASANGRIQERGDDHPQQVSHGDGAHDGDHRNAADLALHEGPGILKQVRFREGEERDRQDRDQLRAHREEHEVQLRAHHAT